MVSLIRNGEIIEVDPHELRLKHLGARARAWCVAMWELQKKIAVRFVAVGLTYDPELEWMPNHITDYLRRVREDAGEMLYGYTWVAELQQRGAVHYHILFAFAPKYHLPQPDGVGGWWHWGSSKVQSKNRPSVGYLTDYITKSEQKRDAYPKGLRIFAAVLRKAAKKILPARPLHWFRLSAAVACVRKFIREFIKNRIFLAAVNGHDLDQVDGGIYKGWRWECLGRLDPKKYSYKKNSGNRPKNLMGLPSDWLITKGKWSGLVHTEWSYVPEWKKFANVESEEWDG